MCNLPEPMNKIISYIEYFLPKTIPIADVCSFAALTKVGCSKAIHFDIPLNRLDEQTLLRFIKLP